MYNFTNEDIKNLFSNLCCSKCRNDFSAEDFTIKERHGDTLICNLTCKKCFKDFGDIVFNFNRKSKNHTPMEIIDGPAPINSDDVIDAHEFIKKMK
jgi:hypothetical protein